MFVEALAIEEPLVSLNQTKVDAVAWRAERSQYYRSNSLLIPYLARAAGVYFDYEIETTLKGEGQIFDNGITGLGRASLAVGKVINGGKKPVSLFEPSNLATRSIKVTEDGIDYLDEEPVLPDMSDVKTHYAGQAGWLFFGLIQDILNPLELPDNSDYVTLPAREPGQAYQTFRNTCRDKKDAKLCSNTESYFSYAFQFSQGSSLRPLEVNGHVVALQKGSGDHTALLVKPAILNGVRLPVGSIMVTDDASNPSFAFGRLSAFSFAQSAEARREFASVFAKEAVLAPGEDSDFDRALVNFNELVGRSNASVSQEEIDRLARLIIKNDTQAATAARVARQDADVARVTNYRYDPNDRKTCLVKLANDRLSLARTFGQPAIEKARQCIDANID